jgi:hypothetical protein
MTTPDFLCKCSHQASVHVHGPAGGECKRNCKCGMFRLADAVDALRPHHFEMVPVAARSGACWCGKDYHHRLHGAGEVA